MYLNVSMYKHVQFYMPGKTNFYLKDKMSIKKNMGETWEAYYAGKKG